MLVLGRKRQESVVIGGAGRTQELVHITVLDVRGGTVKLGFEADDGVAVYREEVWQRICAENRAARPTATAKQPKYQVPYLD